MAVQICKNDAALSKARVLKCQFDTPYSTYNRCQFQGVFVHGIFYRPTDLCLLKGFWKILNFKYDCRPSRVILVVLGVANCIAYAGRSPKLVTISGNIYNTAVPAAGGKTLLFYNILTWNNKNFLILPSSLLPRYSSAPKTKIFFQMIRCFFEIIEFIHFHPLF